MLTARQFSVHWHSRPVLKGSSCITIHKLGRGTGRMTSPFISVLLQSMIAMVTMIAPATHEPVVVVTDWSVPDRGIESIGSVIRRWGCYQSLWWRVTLLRKLLYCVFFNELQGSIWINPATSFSPKAFSLCCTMSDGVQYKKNFSLCSDNRFRKKHRPLLPFPCHFLAVVTPSEKSQIDKVVSSIVSLSILDHHIVCSVEPILNC